MKPGTTLALFIISVCPCAWAAPPDAPPADTATASPDASATADEANFHHRRDRVYVGASTGIGPHYEFLTSEPLEDGRIQGNTTGVGSAGSLALGWTLTPRWVLGGAIHAASLLSSTYRPDEAGGALPSPEVDPSVRSLFQVGPFVDWHPTPGRGLHLEAGLGFAVLNASQMEIREEDYSAIGGGLHLGVGYEWPTDDRWWFGVLVGTEMMLTTGEDDAGTRWTHFDSTGTGLRLTATYN